MRLNAIAFIAIEKIFEALACCNPSSALYFYSSLFVQDRFQFEHRIVVTHLEKTRKTRNYQEIFKKCIQN